MSGHTAKLNKEIKSTDKKRKELKINPIAYYDENGNILEESKMEVIEEQKELRDCSEEYNREIGELEALGKNPSHLKEETKKKKINEKNNLEEKINELRIMEDANYRALEKKAPRKSNL